VGKVSLVHYCIFHSAEKVTREWQLFQMLQTICGWFFPAVLLNVFLFAIIKPPHHSALSVTLHPMQCIIHGRSSGFVSDYYSENVSGYLVDCAEAAKHANETHHDA
jgi:hypothetical protein